MFKFIALLALSAHGDVPKAALAKNMNVNASTPGWTTVTNTRRILMSARTDQNGLAKVTKDVKKSNKQLKAVAITSLVVHSVFGTAFPLFLWLGRHIIWKNDPDVDSNVTRNAIIVYGMAFGLTVASLILLCARGLKTCFSRPSFLKTGKKEIHKKGMYYSMFGLDVATFIAGVSTFKNDCFGDKYAESVSSASIALVYLLTVANIAIAFVVGFW